MNDIEALFEMISMKREKGVYSFSDLENLYSVDLATVRNPKTGQTLLHIAAGYGRVSWIKYLLSHGANVNAVDNEGQAPLHNATCHGHCMASRLLIASRANVNLLDNKGLSPLFLPMARKENSQGVTELYWKVIKLLLDEGADPKLTMASGRHYLSMLKVRKDRAQVCLLHLLYKLRAKPESQRQALIESLMSVNNFFEIIKDCTDIETMKIICTPKLIHSRLQELYNITPLHRAAGHDHLELAQLLIERGADVNATDDNGRIPLHNAAKFSHIEMIELLANHGSEINRQDKNGESPLHEAATHKSSTACLKLIELGANVNLRCCFGRLPYDLAESEDVRETLKPSQVEVTKSSSSSQAIYISTARLDGRIQYKTDWDPLLLDSASDKPLFENAVHSIKLITLERDDPKFRMVKERMLSSIVAHAESGIFYSTYEVVSIEMLLHKIAWRRYQRLIGDQLEDYGVPKNEKMLFHGSSSIDKIKQSGFDVGYAKRDGMFGAGIYFADHSSKSNQYSFGWGQGCLQHKDRSCYICDRKMIYAQVALGRPLIAKEPMCVSHAPPGFCSVIGLPGSIEGLNYPEYVVYSEARAYPLFFITYRLVP